MYQGINISRDNSKRSVDAFPLLKHGLLLSWSEQYLCKWGWWQGFHIAHYRKRLIMTPVAKWLPTTDILFKVPLAIARGWRWFFLLFLWGFFILENEVDENKELEVELEVELELGWSWNHLNPGICTFLISLPPKNITL